MATSSPDYRSLEYRMRSMSKQQYDEYRRKFHKQAKHLQAGTPKQRKKLTVPYEQMFMAMSLAIGRPPSWDELERLEYAKAPFIYRAVWAWLLGTEKGKEFMRILLECGEAQSRAKPWFILYRRWYALERSPHANT